MKLLEVRHISVSIARSPADVYAFASKPENMAKWAAGLESLGDIQIRFAPPNEFGVLDHDVTFPSGEVFHNPLRVVPNGKEGSEVTFTLFRQPGVSDDELAADAEKVTSDLATLKALLERG